MIRLSQGQYRLVWRLYAAATPRFPLIGAVLTGDQDGMVLVDNVTKPTWAYVEHAFGFSRVLGEDNPFLEDELGDQLLRDKGFAATKVRMYAPNPLCFLDRPEFGTMRSWRQRFALKADPVTRGDAAPRTASALAATLVRATADNVEEIDRAFDLVCRFWRNAEDFVGGASAVVAVVCDKPVAICYAAAIAVGEAEIDVLVRKDQQGRGFGRMVVSEFIRRCRESGIAPLWDCFTNNHASMRLARSLGFVSDGPAYSFYTISR